MPTPHLRPFLVLVLALGVSLVLGGCTGSPSESPPDEGADDPSDEDASGELDPDELVPEEIGSLVKEITGSRQAGEGATGYVFNEETRELVPDAKVVVQCQKEGLELPTSPQVLVTDENGHFALPAGDPLAECDLVSYQALHPGLQQESLLTGPPLEPGKGYLVLIGLRPVE